MTDSLSIFATYPLPLWLIVAACFLTLSALLWAALPLLMKRPDIRWPFRNVELNLVLFLLIAIGAILFLFAIFAAAAVLEHTFTTAQRGGEGPNLGAGALIAALLGAPFVIWTTIIKQKTLGLSETSMFNDKVNAAVTALHSRRQVTRTIKVEGEEKILTEWQDDIVQRVGAMDRLLRLGQERPEELESITNLLLTYVHVVSAQHPPKENTYISVIEHLSGNQEEFSEDELEDFNTVYGGEDGNGLLYLQRWASRLQPYRTDVEKCVRVIGELNALLRASERPAKINLSGVNLQGFNLEGIDLSFVDLTGASLEGAKLRKTDLQGSILREGKLCCADLVEARLEDADLGFAHLQLTDFTLASFNRETNLHRTEFAGARAMACDLSSTSVSQAQIDKMFLAHLVRLPHGKIKRQGWEGRSSLVAFYEAHSKWLAESPPE